MSSRITIVGNLTADPRSVETQNGTLVAFTVAETSRRQVNGEWTDGATTYYDVRTFNGLGANIAKSLTKGQHVIVVGDLEAKVSEKDGVKYTNLSVFGREVGVSLRFGTAEFTKGTKSSTPSVDEIVDE